VSILEDEQQWVHLDELRANVPNESEEVWLWAAIEATTNA
jgi:hypothetical protein